MTKWQIILNTENCIVVNIKTLESRWMVFFSPVKELKTTNFRDLLQIE